MISHIKLINKNKTRISIFFFLEPIEPDQNQVESIDWTPIPLLNVPVL